MLFLKRSLVIEKLWDCIITNYKKSLFAIHMVYDKHDSTSINLQSKGNKNFMTLKCCRIVITDVKRIKS